LGDPGFEDQVSAFLKGQIYCRLISIQTLRILIACHDPMIAEDHGYLFLVNFLSLSAIISNSGCSHGCSSHRFAAKFIIIKIKIKLRHRRDEKISLLKIQERNFLYLRPVGGRFNTPTIGYKFNNSQFVPFTSFVLDEKSEEKCCNSSNPR